MTEFEKRVYNVVRRIPRGKILTYGAVARAVGDPKAARAVGLALNKNYSLQVPCYRVVRGDGKVGGYNRGTRTKIALLKAEGIEVKNGKWKKRPYLK